MEPDLEPRRRTEIPKKPTTSAPGKRPPAFDRPVAVTVNEEPGVNYSRQVCMFMGVILITVGLIGFVMDNFLAAHLSYVHNVIHVVTGVLAIGFGYYGLTAAKNFSYAFAVIYGLLGVFGFILGTQGMSTVGHIGEDRFMWKIRPEVLELGSTDHIIHIAIAGIFLAGALYTSKRKTTGASQ